MVDFLLISTKHPKKGIVEIYPKFVIKKSQDLMIRGRDFYAVWIEELGLWSTDEQDAIRLIDRELDKYAKENADKYEESIRILHLWDSDTGMIEKWHRYCQKHMRDNFHMLDEKIIFSNMTTTKKDFASKRLDYPLEAGDFSSYDKLMTTLYSTEEREKIEWAIGAVVSGDSKKIQKFMVLYGSAGTGKSTVLNIIQQLFEGYYSVFDAKALGSTSNSFALEAFRSNPMVAIQHDGDLSRIEDNTRLNSLVSHEIMTVNEKFKATYSNRFKCFLFMGTNKPVRITDAKSGLIRRLIDVSPSGNKVPQREYNRIMTKIGFELGAIAYHCQEVYQDNPNRYDSYIPINMLGASNDFYNYILDSYHVFKKNDGTSLKAAWEMYKEYCEDAKIPYPMTQRSFKEELKNYFETFQERVTLNDDTRVRNYYSGFLTTKFEEPAEKQNEIWTIAFLEQPSVFDNVCSEFPAQYATSKETPSKKWEKVDTKLSDLDTSKLHYVKMPENHIVIDFDIPDEHGNKSLEKNMEAASKWPVTYGELSKSGSGIHLHYIYAGDPKRLCPTIEDHVEIKVFLGNSALRRKLTKCNNLPIATISSGLPIKEEKYLINKKSIQSEKGLRSMIERNMSKEFHPGTKPSVDFIFKILEDAYKSGMNYDVSDMKNTVLAFAAGSTHHADYCIKLVSKMKWRSEEQSENHDSDTPIIFYDVEVFPNLFLANYKIAGDADNIVRLINPAIEQIEDLLRFRLIGFNCRRYDNHILYAGLMGYNNEQLYNLSQKIISGDKNAFFGEAYNLSYTDIYDFASAGNKKSLKKLEIEMGIHHQELGLPWDQPVPKEKWLKVAEYCDNDVLATEAAFHYLSADWTARQILADLANMTVNDTTNSLTTRIIFGREKKPQTKFNYRDLSQPFYDLNEETYLFLADACPEMMEKTHGEAGSFLPYFPGYRFENGKSTYRGEEVGEGGYVYAEPGIYGNVALLDIVSMHPHTVIAECLFGVEYTQRFKEIVDGRVHIKYEDWDSVEKILDEKLAPYIQKVEDGEMSSKQLANALKTAINSVYGLTDASFPNAFRDSRNVDNIVAKRGALFMVNLKHEVQERGFTVAHIKTDSIKIPDATPEIIKFVMDYGKRYGYTFEHEATYDRMCLVNDAVYIAKYASAEKCKELYDYCPSDNKKSDGKWTATGTQFQVPYVFKKLFSKENINFEDMCETKSVSTAIYLDMNESLEDGKHDYHFIGKVGQFCPIKPGCKGGVLYREKDGKYYAVGGTKGYRWLESEMVRTLGKEQDIDTKYYEKLCDDAIGAIVTYGDYNWFVSDEPYIGPEFIDGKPHYLDEVLFN